MRILLVHNSYRQPGGEDRVFATEAQALREQGDQVFTYSRQNPAEGGAALLRLAGQAFWNQRTYMDVRQLITEIQPDVVHLHNTFPLISPAACYAARRAGVATVQTLHNYRLSCPNGIFFRQGRPCEDCLNKAVPWPAVVHACYRNSYAASLIAAGTVGLHRGVGTWTTQIDRFIALTEFARQKFIAGGLPADRVVVKPNLVHPDRGPGSGEGGFALFVGRLSHEKGLKTLLAAWEGVDEPMPLVIVGDGPLAPLVRLATAERPTITWLGQKSPEDVQELMGRATCVIVPSVWYETFGLVVAEAFARGTPVVAARLGALSELVEHQRTGFLFTPGDSVDLAAHVRWFNQNRQALGTMRKAARAAYERLYSIRTNYQALSTIYGEAIAASRARR